MKPKRLVLVGAGHAQLPLIRALGDRHPAGWEGLLLAPAEALVYSGRVPQWLRGEAEPASFRIPLAPWVARAGLRWRHEAVVGWDAEASCVLLATGERVSYDLASACPGGAPSLRPWQSLGDRLLPLKPWEAFLTAWPAWLAHTATLPKRHLVVVGGGPAALELCLAFAQALSAQPTPWALDLVAGEAGPLGAWGPRAQGLALRLLARAQVRCHAAEARAHEGQLWAGQEALAVDGLVVATRAQGPTWWANSGLALSPEGRLRVDAHLCSISHPQVWGAGDATEGPAPAPPPSGVLALKGGAHLAHNLLATMEGRPLKAFAPQAQVLSLIDGGAFGGLGHWRGLCWEGPGLQTWKAWLDGAFLRRWQGPTLR